MYRINPVTLHLFFTTKFLSFQYTQNCTLTTYYSHSSSLSKEYKNKCKNRNKPSHAKQKLINFSHACLWGELNFSIWIQPPLLLEGALPRHNFIGYRRSSRLGVQQRALHRFMGPVFQSQWYALTKSTWPPINCSCSEPGPLCSGLWFNMLIHIPAFILHLWNTCRSPWHVN